MVTEDPEAFEDVWEATAALDDFLSWELDLVGDLGNLVGGGVSLSFCSEKSYTDRSTVACWGFSTVFSLSFSIVVFGTFVTSDSGLVGGGVLGSFSNGADKISTSLSVGEGVS